MICSLLYSLMRQGHPEIQVFGDICVSDDSGVLFRVSEVRNSFPVRSLLKPFQFVATKLGREKYGSVLHLAALGSISASKEQVEKIREAIPESVANQNSPKTALLAYPMDEKHKQALKVQGLDPKEIYHTCFSKHLVILEACKRWGWSESNYLSEEHPYHKNLNKLLESLLEKKENSLQFVKDGCGLPTPVLSLSEMAKLFQVLAQGTLMPELGWVRNWMIENPEWVGGPDRVDTLLMIQNPGKLIAKEGADGLLAIGLLPSTQYPKGLGIILKMAGGYEPQKSLLALKPILETLSLQFTLPPFQGQELKYHYLPWQQVRKDIIDISPELSSESAVWPGDTPFSLSFSHHVNQGNHLTLSKIETTVHVGSHTDSPVHFEKDRGGIETIDLNSYCGACQVISVKKNPHTEIVPEDLKEVEIVAPRVLFRTGSFPNPNKFNTDFNSLSAELVEYLSKKGVVLVGIDTPSIDLFESQTLPSHHATLATRMAILEGVVLEDCEPGVYQLIALPLKVKNADASPVRAVLIR